MSIFVALKSIYGNFFTNAAAIGSHLHDTDAVQAVETGAQLKFIFTTMGGFVDLNFHLGVVAPWYRQNTVKEPVSTLFLGLGLYTPL